MAGLFYHAIFALLVVLLLMPIFKRIQSDLDAWTMLAIGFSGAVFVGLYLRFHAVRLFLTCVSPGIVVIPMLFLFFSPVTEFLGRSATPPPSAVESTAESQYPPVVMLIFDELPLFSLLDREGNIDPTRFPSFAELAAEATWYKNATTVAETTYKALAALLSGLYPAQQSLASHYEYSKNLFTLLDSTHRLNVFESITQLCPPEICPRDDGGTLANRMVLLFEDLTIVYGHLTLPNRITAELPDIQNVWLLGRSSFLDQSHFDTFLNSLDGDETPRFHFYHSPLPHYPWTYLPSGKRYSTRSRSDVFFKGQRWNKSEAVVQHAFQRYLLQLRYADHVLGRLIRRLRQTGLYDRALFVVLADHGVSFRPGQSHRRADPRNLSEIMSVPLLVRFPGQVRGRVSSANAELVDLLPTIADTLNVPFRWEVDGVSLLSHISSKENRKMIFRENGAAPLVRFPNIAPFSLGVCLEGRMRQVGTGNLVGVLRGFEKKGEAVKLWGAAGDPIAGEPAETILVFFNGQLVQRAPVGEGRPYVAAYYKNPKLYASGFHLLLKSPLIEQGQTPIIRIFVARGDEFSELIYPPGYPWHEDPQSTSERKSYASSCDPVVGASYLVREAAREAEVEHSEQGGYFFDRLRKRGTEAGSELILPPLIFSNLLRLREDQLKVEKIGFQVELEAPELYTSVDLEGPFVPAEVAGKIVESEGIPLGAQLLLVLNGVVANIVPLFQDAGGELRFLAVLPEGAFIQGSNRLGFYLVWEAGDQVRLASATH